MKVLILLCLVAAAYANDVSNSPTYDIIARHLIPLAEKIRKAEDSNTNGRIVGGAQAILGQFPYQVGTLSSYQAIAGVGVCGGSLITVNRVLYAAHCWFDGVNQAWRVTIAAGTVQLFTGGVRIDTSTVAVHPSWSPILARNDVAVLYLPQSLILSDTIAPIALPSGDLLEQDFSGLIATASGFGLISDDATISVESNLQYAPLQIIPNLLCSLSFPIIIQESNICTSGAGGIGTCRGDSGGPLAIVSNGQRVLVGVTSFGAAAGCEAGRPAAFARVSSFLDFIKSNLQ